MQPQISELLPSEANTGEPETSEMSIQYDTGVQDLPTRRPRATQIYLSLQATPTY